MDFRNCEFPKKRGYDVLYDEIKLFDKKKTGDFKDELKKVETLYRQLKQKYKADHDEANASHWHYQEKEMQRHGVKGFFLETSKNITKYLMAPSKNHFPLH